MKAMIIADDEIVIERVKSVVKAAGYDTIVYRWLLKALDNIEEISPHLIVISAKEYPRHWKTLAQFATMDFGGYQPQIILYTGGLLAEEDLKKARILHIRGNFASVDVEGLDELRSILSKNDDIYSGLDSPAAADLAEPAPAVDETSPALSQEAPAGSLPEAFEEEVPTVEALLGMTLPESVAPAEPEPASEEKKVLESGTAFVAGAASAPSVDDILKQNVSYDENEIKWKFAQDEVVGEEDMSEYEDMQPPSRPLQSSVPCTLVFTNPLTGALVTGISRNYDGNTVEFEPDFDVAQLTEGTEISPVSLKTGETITAFKARVISAHNPFVLKLA